MIYIINGKYYINISPSRYVEVLIENNGSVKPTKNKIEVGSYTPVLTTTVNDVLKNMKKTVVAQNEEKKDEMRPRRNRRKK